MNSLALILAGLVLVKCQDEDRVHYKVKNAAQEENADFWYRYGEESLSERLSKRQNTRIAKNIVFFLGDGMGVSTVTSARIYKGQKRRLSGEEGFLEMDRFPYVSLSKTYAVDKQTPDSASTATAYLCGVKANYATLGVTSKVKRGECDAAAEKDNQVTSIMDWAQREGKWTGIVTTESVTDASPAGTYAHSADRKYEANVPEGCRAKDIAQQLIHDRPGSKFRVILGGGRKYFLPKSPRPDDERMVQEDNPAINGKGARDDGRNLIEEWLQKHADANRSAAYLWNSNHLKMLHEGDYNVDYILGLFSDDNFEYMMEKHRAKLDGEEIPAVDQPTLEEMTRSAINLLAKSPTGFVLFVEGAKIDTAHHANLPGHSMEEVYQMDKAIKASSELLSDDDTLTIVTADHSHAFTLAGYASRGADILGNAGVDDNGTPYRTLSYAAGPGTVLNGERADRFSYVNEYLAPAMTTKRSGVHGGEDVAVYAKGPWAHLFSGTHEQSYIPFALGYAACIGPNKAHCPKNPSIRKGKLHNMGPIIERNHTIIDHINGRPLAQDVIRPARPPPAVPQVIPASIPADVTFGQAPLPVVQRRASTVPFEVNGRIPQVPELAQQVPQEVDSVPSKTASRVVRKVVRRTNNPFNVADST